MNNLKFVNKMWDSKMDDFDSNRKLWFFEKKKLSTKMTRKKTILCWKNQASNPTVPTTRTQKITEFVFLTYPWWEKALDFSSQLQG